ncbi:hypothetical protein JVT61DRAFT_14893 [Boletus reticuloceps]|uniref:Uncharacterized protein n=1 Tax=Boletus reticuloceps TaxID=495285 RepID=A0A8I3A2T5_9AGAM|nr:hypothetical protein JVT61DRAFT_14893 [Boletus reticuloceps]
MSTTVKVRTCLGPNGLTTLNTLELSVHFHGAVFHNTMAEKIPVQISVHLCDQWSGQPLLPVICDMSNLKEANKSSSPAMFPFLPLPSQFEPTNAHQWEQLTNRIEERLVADPHLESEHLDYYRLTRELFWMAYIAAHPEFPRGQWSRWNSVIMMEGEFMSHWMLKGGYSGLLDTPPHLVIWEQFRGIVSNTMLIPSAQ